MKLLPLGTVIKLKDHKACIIGYSSVEKESKTVCGYFVVSYPLGFTKIDKVLFIPHDFTFEVVAEGFKTRASEQVLDVVAKGIADTNGVSREDLVKFNQLYKEKVLSNKGASEE